MTLILKNLFVQKLMGLFLIDLKIRWIWLQIFTEIRIKTIWHKNIIKQLRNYNPTKPKKIKVKEETLIAVEKLLNNRQEVIDAFKTDMFPCKDGFQKKRRIITRIRRIRTRIRRKRVRKKKMTLKNLSIILRIIQKILTMICLICFV